MIPLNQFWVGVLRGVGYPALMLVLAYLSDANHWASGGISLTVATLIAAVFSGLDHWLESKYGTVAFGAARTV